MTKDEYFLLSVNDVVVELVAARTGMAKHDLAGLATLGGLKALSEGGQP